MAKRRTKKRKRKANDETLILERLREGTLTVCLSTAVVRSTLGSGRELVPFYGGRPEYEYWFVRVCKDDKRRAIAVARLVYIAGRYAETGVVEAIPAGQDVHHIDGDVNNNAYSNLRLEPNGIHQATHNANGYPETWDDDF